MKSETIRIDDLRLRIPGLTREGARQLGEAVARRLQLSPLRSPIRGTVPAISVRLVSGRSASVDHLADAIAARIRLSIR